MTNFIKGLRHLIELYNNKQVTLFFQEKEITYFDQTSLDGQTILIRCKFESSRQRVSLHEIDVKFDEQHYIDNSFNGY